MLLSLALWFAYAGVSGTFRGTVVRGPDQHRGWIYVAGRNESLRRVEITQAVVSYDEKVPLHLRGGAPRRELVEGAEIRVTAEPDAAGGWHATEIEIVRLSPKKKRATASARSQL